MRINENMLKTLIKVPNEIKDITNTHITEVDSFNRILNINNLVIGHVLEVKPHENADKLSVTKVDLGDKIEQIVCGAPNVAKGQYVIVAREGAILPGEFLIKPTKIRGIESNGMICSLDELGFTKENIPKNFKEGIYYFNEEKEIGSNALKHLALDGFIMDLDLTPNRSDLLSHYGFAMDLSAVTNEKVELPKFKLEETKKANPLSVKILSKQTNSYYARYIEDVKITESPMWLKSTLTSLGINPVNNVVDITNYLLFMYGIPMHAFDANKFGSTKIVVKDNTEKQTLKTLDDSLITLTKDEILITNNKEAMAIGGIMGLENSMITNETTNVILEVASFNKDSIRRISEQTNLTSDSQLRFSRGINENLMEYVIDYAGYLIQELASGKVSKGVSKDVLSVRENPFIEIEYNKINSLLGTNITSEEILKYLEKLNYEIKNENNKIYAKAPGYRNDILISADITEEIGRIYGLDKIANKMVKTSTIGSLTNKQKRIRTIRHLLANMGLNEIITYSLLKEDEVLKYDEIGEKLSVLKPMTNDRKTLRQSLLNGGIDVLNYNKNREIDNLLLFEIGNVYAKGVEELNLSVLITGETNQLLWDKKTTKIDFYYISGILNKLMTTLGITYKLKENNHNKFHPHQQASIVVGKKEVGIIGKIHPLISNKHDYFVLELKLDKLPNKDLVKYEKISKFPNIERDLAIVLKEDVKAETVLNLVKQTARNILVDTYIFDVYKGIHIEKGFQSIAVRMVFNDKEKTLESVDIDKVIKKIIVRIERELSGIIRT